MFSIVGKKMTWKCWLEKSAPSPSLKPFLTSIMNLPWYCCSVFDHLPLPRLCLALLCCLCAFPPSHWAVTHRWHFSHLCCREEGILRSGAVLIICPQPQWSVRQRKHQSLLWRRERNHMCWSSWTNIPLSSCALFHAHFVTPPSPGL